MRTDIVWNSTLGPTLGSQVPDDAHLVVVSKRGVAEHDLCALGRVGVPAHQGLVPHFEEAVIGVVERGRGNTGEVIALPGQVLELDQRGFGLLRFSPGTSLTHLPLNWQV